MGNRVTGTGQSDLPLGRLLALAGGGGRGGRGKPSEFVSATIPLPLSSFPPPCSVKIGREGGGEADISRCLVGQVGGDILRRRGPLYVLLLLRSCENPVAIKYIHIYLCSYFY